LKVHGNGNKPLLPLLVCEGWTRRYSPLLVALPFVSLLPILLFLSFFSTIPQRQPKTYTQRLKQNKTKRAKRPQKPQVKTQTKKQKRERKQRGHKDLKQSHKKLNK